MKMTSSKPSLLSPVASPGVVAVQESEIFTTTGADSVNVWPASIFISGTVTALKSGVFPVRLREKFCIGGYDRLST
jgi:hypothetical protein